MKSPVRWSAMPKDVRILLIGDRKYVFGRSVLTLKTGEKLHDLRKRASGSLSWLLSRSFFFSWASVLG